MTRADDLIAALKNNRYVALLVVFAVIIGAVAQFTTALQDIAGLFPGEDDPTYRVLTSDLGSLEKALEGFRSRTLAPDTIQAAYRGVSAAADRACQHRTEIARLGDEDTYEELALICRGVQELGNVCDPEFNRGHRFEVRALTAVSLAVGLNTHVGELRSRLQSRG